MESIEVSSVSGRIVGYELDDDNNAILKVKGEDGKVSTAITAIPADTPIPTGRVTIRTIIEFEKPERNVASGMPNVLFGKDGAILINPETRLPFVARTGPAGRTDAEKKALEKAEKAHGGRANSNLANKLKAEYKKFSPDETGFEDWNKQRSSK